MFLDMQLKKTYKQLINFFRRYTTVDANSSSNLYFFITVLIIMTSPPSNDTTTGSRLKTVKQAPTAIVSLVRNFLNSYSAYTNNLTTQKHF